METYGRNRDSIADLETQLEDAIVANSNSYRNEDGEPVIPGVHLMEVFNKFSEMRGYQLLSKDEVDQLQKFLSEHQELQVTPPLLLQFVAEKTRIASPPPNSPSPEFEERGRSGGRRNSGSGSRSSSGDSIGTSRNHSRPPSVGPPQTPRGSSVFDTGRRQRATPLGQAAPSSWTKPRPHRRKSDAGSRSDSEYSSSPSAFNGGTPRTRAPSNPTSPSSSYSSLSPTLSKPPSRPHSRNQSVPQNTFTGSAYRSFGSPPPDDHGLSSPEESDFFANSINSLPMPRNGSDSEDEDENDTALGLIMDRSAASSTVSMEESERAEALQRVNAELSRKLQESSRLLELRMREHEDEILDLSNRLEELKNELSSTKREEKELRAKERQNMQQINALEADIAKANRSLEQARTTYSSLQRQYAEQCTVSERYRVDLRKRDELVRNMAEAASLQELEADKWKKEQATYEERIARLQDDLQAANVAHNDLVAQKQENLMLKETIDRLRYDMDEMRTNMTAVTGGASNPSSAANTMSKSLGAELMGKMKENWEEAPEEEEEEVEEAEVETQDSDGEDVVQTIITRKKRRFVSRGGSKVDVVEESKEYTDNFTQYEAGDFFHSSATQTDSSPKVLSVSSVIQTDEIPHPTPEPLPSMSEMQIQTDPEEPVRSVSPDEASASSSSTAVPSTPKAAFHHLDVMTEQPPAYSPSEEEERKLLHKWHEGLEAVLDDLPHVISEGTREDWKAVKEELGVDCAVIDKLLENAQTKNKASTSRRRLSGKITNIYNTYIYPTHGLAPWASHVVAGLGGAAVVALIASSVAPDMSSFNVPGGAVYNDRVAWNSYNTIHATGEGFDGPWAVVRGVLDGSARMVQGWPT